MTGDYIKSACVSHYHVIATIEIRKRSVELIDGHIDVENSQLIESPSTISGTPHVYFSPDSLMAYAVSSGSIRIYTFQASTGKLGVHSGLLVKGKVSVAVATLYE